MKLLLLTARYPYLPGEEFVETEIGFLVQQFNEVIVVPSRIDGKIRDLPAGAVLDTTLAERLAKSKWRRRVSSFLAWEPWIETIRQIPKSPRLSCYKRVAKSWSNSQETYRWLRGSDYLRGDSTKCMCYTYWFGFQTLALAIYAERVCSRLQYVTRCHGVDLYLARSRHGFFPFRNYVLSSIKHVYPCTVDGENHLLQEYPEIKGKVTTAYLGVGAAERLNPMKKDGALRICSCAYVTKVKRLDKICDAIDILAKENSHQEIEWTHLGAGKLLPEIKERADRLPSTVSVVFRGETANSEVLNYYASQHVDVFVNSSEREGLPVSIMEAMSHGIPVVAPDVGGIRELVNETNGALLSSNATPREIAHAILRCSSEPSMRRSAYDSWDRIANAEKNYKAFAKRLSAQRNRPIAPPVPGS